MHICWLGLEAIVPNPVNANRNKSTFGRVWMGALGVWRCVWFQNVFQAHGAESCSSPCLGSPWTQISTVNSYYGIDSLIQIEN